MSLDKGKELSEDVSLIAKNMHQRSLGALKRRTKVTYYGHRTVSLPYTRSLSVQIAASPSLELTQREMTTI